jgi:hypothetical protein
MVNKGDIIKIKQYYTHQDGYVKKVIKVKVTEVIDYRHVGVLKDGTEVFFTYFDFIIPTYKTF